MTKNMGPYSPLETLQNHFPHPFYTKPLKRFWVILNGNHMFQAFDHMDGPYIQIDIIFMVLLSILMLLCV